MLVPLLAHNNTLAIVGSLLSVYKFDSVKFPFRDVLEHSNSVLGHPHALLVVLLAIRVPAVCAIRPEVLGLFLSQCITYPFQALRLEIRQVMPFDWFEVLV
jgi:hypothetical protein